MLTEIKKGHKKFNIKIDIQNIAFNLKYSIDSRYFVQRIQK